MFAQTLLGQLCDMRPFAAALLLLVAVAAQDVTHTHMWSVDASTWAVAVSLDGVSCSHSSNVSLQVVANAGAVYELCSFPCAARVPHCDGVLTGLATVVPPALTAYAVQSGGPSCARHRVVRTLIHVS